MKGTINKGIQDLVELRFGAHAWEKVKALAKCDEPFFAISQNYPDEMTMALLKAAAEVGGLNLEDLLLEYGKFTVLNTLRKHYPAYYALAGSSAREFLLNMARVHEHVTKSIADAAPPHFEYDELPDGRLLMHYHSQRGLCVVLRGLILGVGILLNEKLDVLETACAQKGAAHCIMEVTFP